MSDSSTPMGSVDRPFNPLSLAIGAGATFIARTVDVYQPHLQETLARAAEHRGTSFVEIYQNCNVFNDKAFADLTGDGVGVSIIDGSGSPAVSGRVRVTDDLIAAVGGAGGVPHRTRQRGARTGRAKHPAVEHARNGHVAGPSSAGAF